MKTGDVLVISTNEVDSEKVTVLDVCSNGAIYCSGKTFEGWIPKIECISENDKDLDLLNFGLNKHMEAFDLKCEVRKLKRVILFICVVSIVTCLVNLL
jgi:hypothetical protein